MDNLIISIGTLQGGGAERVVSEISSMYCDYFRKVTILTWIDVPMFYDIDPRVKLVCAERESGSANRLQQARWVRSFVRRECPDVFLSFLMPFNMLAIVALAFTGTKVIVCERQDPSVVKTPLLRWLRNALYYFCFRIVVQTSMGKQYFSLLLRKKTFVIANPNHITITERFTAKATTKENRIVSVGRLIRLKNHLLLIDAFRKVRSLHNDYILDIYGVGEMEQILRDNINTERHICLCGRTNDVPSAIASAKIFVLSSDVEGMPNALMEAMALGLPCVSTDVSGVRDIIDDGINGFVVPRRNVDALAERINTLIESEELQQKFSEATISVFEKFDKNRVFAQWLDLVSF